MIKITLSEYNALPKDCRGIWNTERDDLPNRAEIRDKYMGKRTMFHYDNGATVLLVEGLGFEIVEGDFYTRKFRCGNSYVSREELEGFPCPFCTKDTTDAQMQRIVEEAEEEWRSSADDANIDKRKWMAEGYDGIRYRNGHGVTYYAVFDAGDCEILKREILDDDPDTDQ